MPITDAVVISLLEEFLELKIAETLGEISTYQKARLVRVEESVQDVFSPICFKERSE